MNQESGKTGSRNGCAHLRVNVRAIVRAFCPVRDARTVGGNCQDCGAEVQRDITAKEIMLGVRQTEWRAA